MDGDCGSSLDPGSDPDQVPAAADGRGVDLEIRLLTPAADLRRPREPSFRLHAGDTVTDPVTARPGPRRRRLHSGDDGVSRPCPAASSCAWRRSTPMTVQSVEGLGAGSQPSRRLV